VAAEVPAEDERRRRLQECVGRLEGDARTAIEARYWQGLDGEAIAKRLGRSLKGAYQLLARARALLARCLEGGRA
jgi:DNA-directed RNA polymerase specialized sigma24 family protein